MNITRLRMTKLLLKYTNIINTVKTIQRMAPTCGFYSTFTLDAFTTEIFERHRTKFQINDHTELSTRNCTPACPKINVSAMNNTEFDNLVTEFLTKNKDKSVEDLLKECLENRTFIQFSVLKKLFRHYSLYGKPEMIEVLQNYCEKIDPQSYRRNGEFLHYLAKAQCIRGNSERGLSILKSCYTKYESLRSFYRIIFRELIQDSVLNRSEASLVIFRKYVLDFSQTWSDHYPLVCFWHICWASTWFSDQMLANELLESSENLLEIIRDKATAFSIMALRDFNEDAVVRLLQTLLKYDMMDEYVAVLQVLFNYKLRNRDKRGCTEIIRNCEALGVKLPSDQQGKYIKMLIDDKKPKTQTSKLPKNFKLKF